MTFRSAVRSGAASLGKIENALAGVILLGLAYSIWHVITFKYLPQPFFYEPADVFADWFNTTYWSRDPGAYDSWNTVYPPLSFVFLRLFSLSSCYVKYRPFTFMDLGPGVAARECDWLAMSTLWAVFFLNLYLIYRVFRRWDPPTAISRTICLGLGLPMVDGLERGNLVLISFTFLLLGLAPLLRSTLVRWLCMGLAINFKIYLIAPALALVLKRRWRWAEGAVIATVLVYLLSYAALGRGNPIEIYENIVGFASQPARDILDFWYSTTYVALVSLMEGDNFPFILMIGSDAIHDTLLAISIGQHSTQLLLMLAALGIWLRPEAVSSYRTINIAILFVSVTSEPGGYAQIYFMLFTLLEPWKGALRKTAIILCYLLAIPLDVPLYPLAEVARDTYFGHTTVLVNFKVMIGPFIRPLLIMIVAACIALVTILDVWRDVRQQGWSSRWRFRRDSALLPWTKAPTSPATRLSADPAA